ncbi:MAG TPA: GNAT family N-acetyltransferase [Kribbellaceae bacterium]
MFEPDLVRRWQAGWSMQRGHDTAVDEGGVLAVPVGEPGRRWEYVVVDADGDPESVRRAAGRALGTEGGAWVSAMTSRPAALAAELRAAGLRVDDGLEWLMSVDLSEQAPARPVASSYRLRTEDHGRSRLLEATVMAGTEPAASGWAAVIDEDAIFDRIVTDPAHRRRGLGAAVMAALVEHARASRAVRGLLVASPDGRHLYESLGWSVVKDVVIARTLATT